MHAETTSSLIANITLCPHLSFVPAGFPLPRRLRWGSTLGFFLRETTVLIPLRHENMRGRRWPYITFALIGLNILIFAFTFGTMKSEAPRRLQVRVSLLTLAARHPDLQMSPAATAYVESVKKQLGDRWERLVTGDGSRQLPNNAEVDAEVDPAEIQDVHQQLQQQMDAACQAFESEKQSDLLANFRGLLQRWWG